MAAEIGNNYAVGNKGGGRKSLKQELSLLTRYQDLTPKCFAVVKKMLDSKKKSDYVWAADWLKVAYVKMLPQVVTGADGGAIEIKLVKYDDNAVQTEKVSASVAESV